MEAITELNYSSTNTYLIEGGNGTILFDTGWAGTLDSFCKELGELSKKVQDIDYIIISHFHPDHMGIAQEIAELGIAGEIIHTPGHTDDSISLWLDEGVLFVGDLNPLYELELHKHTEIEESWNKLLRLKPKRIYYGHANVGVQGILDRIEIKGK